MNALDKRLHVLKSLGYTLTENSTILDFGCGNGKDVQLLRKKGYDAYGCDIRIDKSNDNLPLLIEKGVVKVIDPNDYKIPFGDNTFDVIYSYMVLEHVKNHSVIIREMCRVLKPSGVVYNHFPSKFRFIESHIKVPFASVIAAPWWLYFWAFCGIRNKFQSGLSVKETGEWNKDYLREYTNYITERHYSRLFKVHFEVFKHGEKEFLQQAFKNNRCWRLVGRMNLTSFLFRVFRSVIILVEKPKK